MTSEIHTFSIELPSNEVAEILEINQKSMSIILLEVVLLMNNRILLSKRLCHFLLYRG